MATCVEPLHGYLLLAQNYVQNKVKNFKDHGISVLIPDRTSK